MRRALIVFGGGGLGACLRALAQGWLAPWSHVLPLPVLMINLFGAFILGAVYVLADEAGLLHAETRLFAAVGVLGGFTTFSTFGWGADLLIAHRAYWPAAIYVLGSVVGGAIALNAGLLAGRELVAWLERLAVALLGRLDEHGMRRTGDGRRDMAAIGKGHREESA